MIKYLVIVLLLIGGALVFISTQIGVSKVYQQEIPAKVQPHFYDKPEQKLGDIKIAAFYFVPQNRTERLEPNWRVILEKSLAQLQIFHETQLQGRSKIAFEIYPIPVVGYEQGLSYDTDSTQHGNPEALKQVAGELEQRVFNSSGDLFLPEFAKTKAGEYRVLLILYEGVGASGADNVALVSSTFLFDRQYQQYGSSILAHEFYHTLGIPDGYDLATAIPTSQDLMGLGRLRPIEKTYIERETIRKLGL